MPTVINGKAGKSGRLFIKVDGGSFVELCITQWTTREVANEYDTTGSKSAGNMDVDYGAKRLEGSVTAQWQDDLNPLSAPPTIRVGNKYAMKAYLHATPGSGLEDGDYVNVDGTAGDIKCNNIQITTPAEGVLEFTFDFKTSGSYDYTTS